jgi:excisionase family DNA binding protein
LTPPALLDFEEAGNYLGSVSRSTLKKLRARGDIAAICVGQKHVMFPRESLDAYIARRLRTTKASRTTK